nr:PspC domain-containing protein [Corynebacterium mendelii]
MHRSVTDRYIAGVCGGIAETYNLNSTLIRLLMIASLMLPGPQVLFYLAAWVLMPEG